MVAVVLVVVGPLVVVDEVMLVVVGPLVVVDEVVLVVVVVLEVCNSRSTSI